MDVKIENVKVENIETNVVKLEITVNKDTFEEALNKSFSKNAKRFKVQGFRPGKAPRAMVERLYGPEVLYEDAVNFILPEAYDKAVSENDVEPVDNPEFDIIEIEKGKDFVFTAQVTVKPEVKLGEYKNLKLKKVETEVTDEDVEEELKKIAKQNSRLVPVDDRPVENGDVVYLDYEGFIGEEAFEGGKGENYPLEIGSGTFIPGFEEQLVGKEIGETEVNVTFPEEYHAENLAGKDAVFKCKINEIKKRELPEINDEFAQDVSEFDTLDEYKADIKEKLIKAAEENDKRVKENSVIEKISENSEVEIPQVMIDRQISYHLQDLERNLSFQGLNLQQYLQITSTTMEDLRNQFKEVSEKEVKAQLVVEKVGKLEGIEATEDEFNKKLEEFAKNYNRDVDEMKKLFRPEDIEYIKDQIVYEKTLDFLVNNNEYTLED